MDNNIKNQTKALWDKCFSEEDKRFVDFYFEKRYNEQDNIHIEKDGKVVSAMQLISYPFSYYGKTIGCSYLSGCCTDPDYRSQGLMNDLIIKALNQAKNNGACFAALIPASESLFNYYEGTNFIPTFDYSKIRIKRQQTTDNGQQTATISVFDNESDPEAFYQVYDYFNTKMRARNCCIQHDEYDFGVITKDLELFDNHLLVAKYGDAHGITVEYLLEGEKLHVGLKLHSKEASPYLESGNFIFNFVDNKHYLVNKTGTVISPESLPKRTLSKKARFKSSGFMSLKYLAIV